jgi:hypothetical protein
LGSKAVFIGGALSLDGRGRGWVKVPTALSWPVPPLSSPLPQVSEDSGGRGSFFGWYFDELGTSIVTVTEYQIVK